MDHAQTYQGKRFTIDVLPNGKSAYIRVNGRGGNLTRVKSPTIARSLAIKQGLVSDGVIGTQRLADFVDQLGNRCITVEANRGNSVAIAETGRLLEYTVDTHSGLVVDPNEVSGRDRVGRY